MFGKKITSGLAKAALLLCVLCVALVLQTQTAARAGVMMEGFYTNPTVPSGYGNAWWWDRLAAESQQISQDGFTAIWLPCALKGAAGGYSSGYDPFDDYDLGDKNQMGTIPTHYGNRVQLERLCAMMHANGLQVYEDIVDTHRNGDPGNYSFQYVDAYGNPGGGRFPKSASDFYPNVPMESNTPDPYTTPDGRWIMPITGGQYQVNGQTWVYADYGMKQSGDWLTKALDLNGYRFDDPKASSWTWLQSFMNYGAMAGKFCVSEYFDGNLGIVSNWVTNDMNNRTSAFDFPLRENYLKPMCDNPGSFDMASLDHAGLAGIDPTEAVTFVENHDTDGSDPIYQNKMLAYAYILTSEGYPCVFYRDWSTDPGCYGAGLQAGINNLVWIHEKIASGTTVQRWGNNQVFAYERLGGSHLLVGLSDDSASTHTITCATGFGANVHLHDYTGHEPDVWTDGSGNATITLPVNSNGTGYVAYSVAGLGGGVAPTGGSTKQEYAGAQDLDIKPADNTQFVTAAQIEVNAGSPINGALYYDTGSWTSSTDIALQLLDPTGNVIATKTYTSATAQGTALTATAGVTGYYTFQIRSYNTPAANAKPDYWLDTTYTAPQNLVLANFEISNCNISGGQQVYVVGNVTDLGNWTPADGFALTNTGSGSNSTWSGVIGLPPSTALQYKYVKWDGTTAYWESDQSIAAPNREITTPSSGSVTYDDGNFDFTSPTPLVTAATISGMVSLQEVAAGNRAQPLVFTLTPTGNTPGTVTNQTITPDATTGAFTLPNVPPGTYTLGVKGSKWLRRDTAVDTTHGNVSGLTISLLGGDLNGDNQVSLSDYLMLCHAYNTRAGDANWNVNADLTCDGQVSLSDYLMLCSNYGKQGDP